MTAVDVITSTLENLDDGPLVERWRRGQFSEEALPIARAEMEKRGLDTSMPRSNPDRPKRAAKTRMRIWTIYLALILFNLFIASIFFSNKGPSAALAYSLKYPDYLLVLMAGSVGRCAFYLIFGALIEAVVAIVQKRPKTFIGSLLWSTGLLFLAILIAPS